MRAYIVIPLSLALLALALGLWVGSRADTAQNAVERANQKCADHLGVRHIADAANSIRIFVTCRDGTAYLIDSQ